MTEHNKKKILFILRSLDGGGAEKVTLNVLRHLDPARFDITIFLFMKRGVYFHDVPSHIKVVSGCKSKKLTFKYTFPIVLPRLYKEATQHDLLIGALEFTPTYLAFLLGKLCHKPAVGWVHCSIPYMIKTIPRVAQVFHQCAARFVYKRLTNIVFVSNGAKESLLTWLHETENQTGWQVIYNFIDLLKLVNNTSEYKEKKISDLPIILAIGRLVIEKDFDLLIQAHATVLKNGISHQLIILGEGSQRNELEKLVMDLGVQSSVSMPGFVNNTSDYLNQASLFVLSSRFEGFGLVLLEALAANLPIVSTNCPSGPEEILMNGKYGLLVPTENIEALAEGITKMFTDNELYNHYRSLSPERIKDFSSDEIISQWEMLIEGLI